MINYDVIVVGGGHAGIEASLVSARMGLKTLLITILVEQIGAASCNPAIGGLAKGHLVKEIDALGGQMALATDATGIQFRILNSSKGPAVRGSRAQIDMDRYRVYMRDIVLNQDNLEVSQEIVENLIVENDEVVGLETNLKNRYGAKKVILTTGTFLNGKIHIGEFTQDAGRAWEFASTSLGENLKELGLSVGRLKTGTPARICSKSIDFDILEEHGGDEIPTPFSFQTDKSSFNPTQLPCYITYTNETTHQIIESNFDKAPLFTGQIEGVGPRYCPSIEDKINRFRERPRHQLFIEPQTLNPTEYYLNGMSTSLPIDVQLKMIQSVKGLEDAKIVRFGYAIEYDYVNPIDLKHTLETKKYKNLYLAGQINGTTGYEEAGAQGLMAGINASLSIKGEDEFILRRDESYIGVLIDDLVTKGTKEPYRMFTSRAEFRLLLREDNADLRLSKYGYKFGLIKESRHLEIEQRRENIKEALSLLQNNYLTPSKENLKFLESIDEGKIGDKLSFEGIISKGNFNIEKLDLLAPELKDFNKLTKEQILIEAKYSRYIEKQKNLVSNMDNMLKVKIPEDLDFKLVRGLSTEIIEKLEKTKPKTLFNASLISGVTPAAIDILHIIIKSKERNREK